MCPARATILRNVLIANVSEIVSAVNVVPDPGLGDVVDGDQSFSDERFEVLKKTLTTVGIGESGIDIADDGCCCEEFH